MDSKPTNQAQEQLKRVFEYYHNGRLDDTEKLATSITEEVPLNAVAWKAPFGEYSKKMAKLRSL